MGVGSLVSVVKQPVNITMVTVYSHPSNHLEPPSNHIATYRSHISAPQHLTDMFVGSYAIMYHTLATEWRVLPLQAPLHIFFRKCTF